MKSINSVSIVIPTHNRGEILKRTIPSYLNQKHLKELIVIDDGSTDETEKVITNFKDSRIKYIKNNIKKGSPYCRNVGVENSLGDYILFGEDDAEFSESYTEKLLNYALENNCPIVAGKVIYMRLNESRDSAIKRVSKQESPTHKKNTLDISFSELKNEIHDTFFLTALSLIKRTVFNDIKFDVNYKGNAYREETDFYLSANKLGYKTVYMPDAFVFHLPREIALNGGQRNISRWQYEYYVIKNHCLFLDKHYSYLRLHLGLERSKLFYKLEFAFSRVKEKVNFRINKVIKR